MRMPTWIAGAVLLAAGAGCGVDSRPREEIVFELPDSGPPGVCGPVVCGLGQVCCNQSCGICTPPGGVCTQQLCGPEAVPHLVDWSADRWDFAGPMRIELE